MMLHIGLNSHKMNTKTNKFSLKSFDLVRLNDEIKCYSMSKLFTMILVDRSEDKALLQNDFVQYEITISEASMFVQPYQTK